MPNTLNYSESRNVDWKDSFLFNGKGFGLFNIRTLEEKTGYNFLSNIPIEIQDIIEKRNFGDIKAKLNALDTKSASLMATTDEELFPATISPLRTFYDTSIRHSGMPYQIPATTDQTATGVSTLEFSISKNSVLERTDFSSTKFSTTGIHMIQVASPQISIVEGTPVQAGSTQINITNNCPCQ